MSQAESYVLITGATEESGRILAHEYASAKHNLLLIAGMHTELTQFAQELRNRYETRIEVYSIDLSYEYAAEKIQEFIAEQNIHISTFIHIPTLHIDEGNDATIGHLFEKTRLYIGSLIRMTEWCLHHMRSRETGTIINVEPTAHAPSALGSYLHHHANTLMYQLKNTPIQTSILSPHRLLHHTYGEIITYASSLGARIPQEQHLSTISS